jgi:glycosyltransferase involved in cell wall biosynthesis
VQPVKAEAGAGLRTMKLCLNVTAHADVRFGGLTTTLPRFCRALQSTGQWVAPLVASCEESEIIPTEEIGDLEFERFPSGSRLWLSRGRWAGRLKEHVRRADIVHIHGLWQAHTALTVSLCRRLGRPYVISAHGMLEPWALSQGRVKKRVYYTLLESRHLRHASCLRALTEAEVEDYRRLGLTNECAIVPNGIDVPEACDAAQFLDAYPELRQKRIVLFLGRIHPKKGLDILFQCWNRIAVQHPEAHLVVAGPDEAGLCGQLLAGLTGSSARQRVLFPGVLRGQLKSSALAAADVFVLPSYSEGFSVAILEAMAAGRPVLISGACHFPEVAKSRCGWEIKPTADELEMALKESLSAAAESLRAMGEAGRRLVAERYSWDAVASRAASMLNDCLQ